MATASIRLFFLTFRVQKEASNQLAFSLRLDFKLDKRLSSAYNTLVHQRWINSFLFLVSFLFLESSLGGQTNTPVAKINDILINADSMYRDNEKETAELEGHIQIVFRGQHIKADKARVHLRSRQVELFGNVEVIDTKNTIVGEQVILDYENGTGMIYNGYVKSGSVVFSGSILQKTGDVDYVAATAEYTACTNCPASWSFSGTTVRAELGGYAYIKNAILRFGPVPVFWLPYLIVPLKSDRQSGLLTPSFEISDKGGFAYTIPYFWAISRSSDATIEIKDYAKRGLKGLGEYRYVLNDNSHGILNFGTIYDKSFADESRLNLYRSDSDKNDPLQRWYLRYEHYFEMPDGGVHRAQVSLASDLQYPRDFPTETLNHGDSAMENRFSYTKNSQNQHVSVDTSYYQNLLHGDPLAGNSDSVHRIPEFRFSQTQKNIGDSNFIYSFDFDFANFTRAGNAYDDMDRPTTPNSTIRFPKNTCNSPKWEDDPSCKRVYDGRFDPSVDLIRTGQRVDILPTLYYPIKVSDGLDLVPKLSYRETHYNFNIETDSYLIRRYLRTEITGRSNLSAIYGDDSDPKANLFKHEILPEITYTYLPWLSQGDHPFFGTGSLMEAPYSSRDSINDLDIAGDYGAQFDYNDRVYDRNLMTFAVTNKLTEKRWISGKREYRQIGYLRLAQSYDTIQERKTGVAEPWSDLSATLDVRLDQFQSYSIFNYFPYHNVTNTLSRFRVLDEQGHFAQLQLTRQYSITPGKAVDPSSRQEDYTISAGFVSKYLNMMGKFVHDANWGEATGGKPVKSWAYIAQLKPSGDCMMVTFVHDQVTGGDTNFKFNFSYNWDGVAKAPLPPEALDTYGF